MKKLITLGMTCLLAFSAVAMAQQDDDQKAAKKKARQEARAARQEAHGAAAANPQAERPAAKARANRRMRANENANGPANAPAAAAEGNSADTKAQMRMKKRQRQQQSAQAQQSASDPAPGNKTTTQGSTTTTAAASAPANQPKPNAARKRQAQAKKVDVQKIKAQHANFKARPQPSKVKAVSFTANRQIDGSQHWQGAQYNAFRTYRPERHDERYYRSHYNRIELIAGGYYYFNNGYWYPAWGYQPSAQYYAYDGPIYAGRAAQPPDQVIADVQAALQEMGYYRGEVDGLLGPLTREALTGYQTDNGLYVTAAIDEPTMQSLGI